MASLHVEKEIARLRKELRSSVVLGGTSRAQLQFELGALLGCSFSAAELAESFELFQALAELNYRKCECLYQLAIVSLRLGRYREARQFADTLVQLEPSNVSVLSLQTLIIDRTSHDSICGTLTGLSLLGKMVSP